MTNQAEVLREYLTVCQPMNRHRLNDAGLIVSTLPVVDTLPLLDRDVQAVEQQGYSLKVTTPNGTFLYTSQAQRRERYAVDTNQNAVLLDSREALAAVLYLNRVARDDALRLAAELHVPLLNLARVLCASGPLNAIRPLSDLGAYLQEEAGREGGLPLAR